MKITRLFFVLVFVSGILIQCSTDPLSNIKNLEEKLTAENFTFDEKGMQVAGELIDAYISYADSYKDSTKAPDFLYKAADLSLNLNRSKEALDLYNQIIYQYPEYEKTPECFFLVAYIYENYFQNYGKANEIYESFIEKYPDHEFADDAAISIANMGKSPEELIREFEEKNKIQQDTVNQ